MIAAQNGYTTTCVALLSSNNYTAVNNVDTVSTNITLTSVCICHDMKERGVDIYFVVVIVDVV